MPQAVPSLSTPARALHRAPTARQRRQVLESALDRLLDAVEAALADLDALDGDPDVEPTLGSPIPYASVSQVHWAAGGDQDEREDVSEDEGGACEDEGGQDEREPDDWGWEAPDGGTAYPSAAGAWPPPGTAVVARPEPVSAMQRDYVSPHQNVGAFMPVRAL